MNISELSVVICNKNSLKFLKKSIPVYKKSKIKELIVVDGNSTDGSLEYLEEKKIKTISDSGKGLSYSRQLGINNSNGKIIFIAGPDDICDETFLEDSLRSFFTSKYDAATVCLKIFKTQTYWDYSFNLWFSYIRNKKQSTKVIGTPTYFKRKVFDNIQYDSKSIGCDDTDISEKLIQNNFKIGVLENYCDQINENNFNDVKKKFLLYGKSDINYYRINNKNLTNLFNTLTHPLKHLLKFSMFLIMRMKFKYLPFIFVATIYRYFGIIKKN